MNEKRPLIITFIGDISFLIALLSIIIAVLQNFSVKFGFHIVPFPIFSEGIMKILLPITFLIASIGFLRLKRWGYWLMIIYNTFFLLVIIFWWLQNEQIFISMSFVSTVIALIFIIPTRKYFINVNVKKDCVLKKQEPT